MVLSLISLLSNRSFPSTSRKYTTRPRISTAQMGEKNAVIPPRFVNDALIPPSRVKDMSAPETRTIFTDKQPISRLDVRQFHFEDFCTDSVAEIRIGDVCRNRGVQVSRPEIGGIEGNEVVLAVKDKFVFLEFL